MAEEMHNLRQQVLEINQELTEVKEDNEALRRQNLENSNTRSLGTTGGTQSSSSLKIAKPSEFTGDKDSINIDTFHLQCDLYFSQYPSVVDKQKNSFILSFCKGSVAKWAETSIKENLVNPYFTTLALKGQMIAMWGVANKEEKAARELDALKQSTSTVAEYTSAFRQKSAHCFGFSDYDLRRRYRMGLQQRVRDQLAHVSPKNKDTLDKLVTQALEIGQNLEELDAEKKYSSNRWTPRAAAPYAPKTVSQGGDMMDVDKSKTSGGPRPQGQQGGQGFKCYRCGQMGHMARNCTNAEVPGSGPRRPTTIKAAEVEAPAYKPMTKEDIKAMFEEFSKGRKDF
jgi:regulator of replication initiation timing